MRRLPYPSGMQSDMKAIERFIVQGAVKVAFSTGTLITPCNRDYTEGYIDRAAHSSPNPVHISTFCTWTIPRLRVVQFLHVPPGDTPSLGYFRGFNNYVY
jgi:hypothetical protein